MTIINGHDAIAAKAAQPDAWRLAKYADPTEGYRDNISVGDAIDIAAEDPSLVYATPVSGLEAYHVHDDCSSNAWDTPVAADSVDAALDYAVAQIAWTDYAPVGWTDGSDDPETSVDVTVYVQGPDNECRERTVTVYAPGYEPSVEG